MKNVCCFPVDLVQLLAFAHSCPISITQLTLRQVYMITVRQVFERIGEGQMMIFHHK